MKIRTFPFVLGDIPPFHVPTQGSLLVSLVLMKSAVAAAQGRQMASSASSSPSSGTSQGGAKKMVIRFRWQQIMFYVPTFGEGASENGRWGKVGEKRVFPNCHWKVDLNKGETPPPSPPAA